MEKSARRMYLCLYSRVAHACQDLTLKKEIKKEKNCPPYSVHMLAAAWRWFLAASRSTGSNNVAAKRWPSLWGLERSYPRENYNQTIQRRSSSFSSFRPPINWANVRFLT